MKNFLLASLLSLIGLSATAQTDTLRITTSAVCDMCKRTIEDGLAFTKGVKFAQLNVETKVVTVVINRKKTDVAQVRTAINNMGYDADSSPANAAAYEKLHGCCKKDSH